METLVLNQSTPEAQGDEPRPNNEDERTLQSIQCNDCSLAIRIVLELQRYECWEVCDG